MHEQAIAIFCICEELVKFYGLIDDPQCKMSTSEVMTLALISALHYRCDYRLTRLVSQHLKYFSAMLSYSRLIRRIHAIPEEMWWIVFKSLQLFLKKSDTQYFIVDSLPIKAYENHKSFRARIFQGKNYHGYSASRKQYFFGIKVHMIIDEDGIPIEFCFSPGSMADVTGLKELPCELPEGSIIFADKAYNNYSLEDDLIEMANIKLLAKRKSNFKRQHTQSENYIHYCKRNYIETVFSSIVSRMPRYIRASTEKGFYLKVFFIILAYLLNKSLPAI
jgi:hypothetical protein